MAGTRFVYGDGWEDIKDCFSGTLGLNRGHPDNTGGSSSRSSRQRVYGGDHYVHPHHLGSSSRRSEGCCGLDLGECMGDLTESCNKTRLGLSVLFLWVIVLTIVCIVLGSNIAYSSNSALSERLEDHKDIHNAKISHHEGILSTLDKNHQLTAGRIESVASNVKTLKGNVNVMEVRLRGEVKNKLEDVRSVLLAALEKASKSLQDIKDDVKQGMV